MTELCLVQAPTDHPKVNLNGNTGKDLVARSRTVLNALNELEAAMAIASDVVHGRNFQTSQRS